MKSMSCIPSCSLCLDRRRLARVTSSPVCPLTMQPVRWTQHNSWRNKTISRAICNFLNCAASWKRFQCARADCEPITHKKMDDRKWRKSLSLSSFFVPLLFLTWLNKCFLISLEVMHVFAILCLNLHRCHCGKKPSVTETRTIECAEIFTIVVGRLPQSAIASAALNGIVPNMFLLIRCSA